MTKLNSAIEDELNLPRLEEALAEIEQEDSEEEQVEETSGEEDTSQLEQVKEIRKQLKSFSGQDLATITQDDRGIDEIREKALEAYKDMLEAGFACDSKHASNFLEPAVQALGIAMDTENTKIKKKMEFQRLQIQKEKNELLRRRIELEERRAGQGIEVVDDGSVMMDRNQLIEAVLKNNESE